MESKVRLYYCEVVRCMKGGSQGRKKSGQKKSVDKPGNKREVG